MKNIGFKDVNITGGFWKQKQELNRDVTIKAVHKKFSESPRFDVFNFSWNPDSDTSARPHIFYDSDVAKWMESVCFVIQKEEYKEMEKYVDELVELIIKHQDNSGYFNTYFQQVDPESEFKNRTDHELYCAGHLIEAAIAYRDATGKENFLQAMCRYADYIEKRFKIDRDASFIAPGHEEIELALFKLADATGIERYRDLAKHFIDMRGTEEDKTGGISPSYTQAHLPCRLQREAVGHAVRGGYLYSAMADIAFAYDDSELKEACMAIFENITNKRMYVTGGIGSTCAGESFTVDYDLPSSRSYAESCAAISLAYFARRMQLLDPNAKYADIIERIIYNGFLSSLSLDGKSFYYRNPIEITTALTKAQQSIERPFSPEIIYPSPTRSEEHGCSCCPPNITRFIASIGDYIYSSDEDNGIVFVNQYVQSETSFDFNGSKIKLIQKTSYPENGKVRVEYQGEEPILLAIRIPSWCNVFESEKDSDGYVYYHTAPGDIIELDFKPEVKLIEADPRMIENEGRVAVSYGPFIYCMEEIDNPSPLRDIRIDTSAEFEHGYNAELGVPVLKVRAFRRIPSDKLYNYSPLPLESFTAEFIPYYSFANRGLSDMLIWTLKR